jgi:DNA-directed RNA polymerase specialized sigma24 family protein
MTQPALLYSRGINKVKMPIDINIEILLYKYRNGISKLCNAFIKSKSPTKMEYEDLFQEAIIKLWELSINNKFDINDKSKVMIAIKNRLIDCFRRFEKDPLSEAISINDIEFLDKK